MSEFDEVYSTNPTGMQHHNDVFEPTYQPGTETVAQSQDPLNKALFAPDQTYDPLQHSAWKKEQGNALREGRPPEEVPPTEVGGTLPVNGAKK